MSADEKAAFLAAEGEAAAHAKKKEKMLKNQFKGMKSKSLKGLKKRGRGKARTPSKG